MSRTSDVSVTRRGAPQPLLGTTPPVASRTAANPTALEAPDTFTNSAQATTPWTARFIGKTLADFGGEFPNWGSSYAHATRVIGESEGYGSLAEARAAVAALRPTTAPSDLRDRKTYPNAVAYLENDLGRVAAFELDQPVLSVKGFLRLKLISAPYYHPRDDRMRAIDNFQGSVPQASLR
ncbi:MAG: hypothetical protein IPJ65_34425 [Archangiaceae bacterium]|nr:hypothetical protein [Archangiaceae bacterium]